MDALPQRQTCRAVFVSDLHLGARGCQAERLLAFLQSTDCRTLYLVGDVVDGWRLKRDWRWPRSHDAVLQHILASARRGVEVIYTPGNHDEFARAFYGVHLAGVIVTPEAVHLAADGRRFLVTHGDLYDGTAMRARWLTVLGDWTYRGLMRADIAWNHVRRRLRLGHWSVAGFLKRHSGQAARFIAAFEQELAGEARRRGLDGVICGHLHKAEHRLIDGVTYINDGDWVESCTAAVEHFDGCIEVVDWTHFGGVARSRHTAALDAPPRGVDATVPLAAPV